MSQAMFWRAMSRINQWARRNRPDWRRLPSGLVLGFEYLSDVAVRERIREMVTSGKPAVERGECTIAEFVRRIEDFVSEQGYSHARIAVGWVWAAGMHSVAYTHVLGDRFPPCAGPDALTASKWALYDWADKQVAEIYGTSANEQAAWFWYGNDPAPSRDEPHPGVPWRGRHAQPPNKMLPRDFVCCNVAVRYALQDRRPGQPLECLLHNPAVGEVWKLRHLPTLTQSVFVGVRHVAIVHDNVTIGCDGWQPVG